MTPASRIVCVAVEGICSPSAASPYLSSPDPQGLSVKDEAGVCTVGALPGCRRQQVVNELFSR